MQRDENYSGLDESEEAEAFPEVYYVECIINTNATEGQKSVAFGPFRKGPDELHLAHLIETLNNMLKEFPNGLSLSDTYENVPGFLSWFDSSFASSRSLYKAHPTYRGKFDDYASVASVARRYGGTANNWPRGIVSAYCETPAELAQYKVLFFNEQEKRQRSMLS